ncbi:MAG: DNA-protecting protein DprA, partial [Thermaurantiacus tibetensis]
TLVEDAADVIAALRPFALAGARAPEAPPAPAAAPEAPADSRPADAAERLAALLSPVPVPIDLLVRESGLPAAQVTALLTDMELAGTVVRHSGGRVASA